MAFLAKADLFNYVDESTIDQLTNDNDVIVTDAISDAEDRIREKISPRYDLDTEFTKVGAARNRSLLKHAVNISIYYLFQRTYTDVLPDGREMANDIAEKWLNDVFEGRINVTLATNDEDNQQGWPLRWGSDTKKGSQSY
tara:strand:- start:5876 stop:6295 length:420 start_codon:yes stop_codon:yes gene_type:complete